MKSQFLSLNLNDYIKGFIVAILAAFLASALQLFESGTIQWTWAFWQPSVYAAAIAGISYLLKNVLTNSNDKFAKGEGTIV